MQHPGRNDHERGVAERAQERRDELCVESVGSGARGGGRRHALASAEARAGEAAEREAQPLELPRSAGRIAELVELKDAPDERHRLQLAV